MKKYFFFLSLSLAFSAQARFEIDLQGFDFRYDDPKGSGEASSFSRQMEKSQTGVKVDVEKGDEVFKVVVSGSENQSFEVKEVPGFVKEARTMSLDQMFFNFSDALNLSLDAGEFVSEKDELSMVNLDLNCGRDEALKDIMDQVISGCVRQLSLKSQKFSSQKAKRLLNSFFSNKGSSLGIKNLDLTSKNGAYNLEADVKAQISGTARSKGNLSYDPTAGVLSIKISEVKFGILNVKKMVFDELRKDQDENMKVNEPYVYLKVK